MKFSWSSLLTADSCSANNGPVPGFSLGQVPLEQVALTEKLQAAEKKPLKGLIYLTGSSTRLPLERKICHSINTNQS